MWFNYAWYSNFYMLLTWCDPIIGQLIIRLHVSLWKWFIQKVGSNLDTGKLILIYPLYTPNRRFLLESCMHMSSGFGYSYTWLVRWLGRVQPIYRCMDLVRFGRYMQLHLQTHGFKMGQSIGLYWCWPINIGPKYPLPLNLVHIWEVKQLNLEFPKKKKKGLEAEESTTKKKRVADDKIKKK